jgi:hypothetical protein
MCKRVLIRYKMIPEDVSMYEKRIIADATLLSRVSRRSGKSDEMQGDMTRAPLPHSDPHIHRLNNACKTIPTLQLPTAPQLPTPPVGI